MNTPEIPPERAVTDAVWAEIGAAHPGSITPGVPQAALSLTTRLTLAGLALVLTAAGGGCVWLLGDDLLGPNGKVIAIGITGMVGGMASGALLAGRYSLAGLKGRGRSTSRPLPEPTRQGSQPPMAVIHSPPPPLLDPQTLQLEEHLLHLCKEDRRLFERLLHYERTRNPGERRAELLRLAIEHFERDLG
jgi:hypothetical protein